MTLNGIFGKARGSGISDGATGIEELERPGPAAFCKEASQSPLGPGTHHASQSRFPSLEPATRGGQSPLPDGRGLNREVRGQLVD